MKEEIYLQVKDEDGNDNPEITWCEDKIFDTDLTYKLVKEDSPLKEKTKFALQKE